MPCLSLPWVETEPTRARAREREAWAHAPGAGGAGGEVARWGWGAARTRLLARCWWVLALASRGCGEAMCTDLRVAAFMNENSVLIHVLIRRGAGARGKIH